MSEQDTPPVSPGEQIVRSEARGITLIRANPLVDRGLRDIALFTDDIFEAVRASDIERVRNLLAHDPKRSNYLNHDGEPILCVAAMVGNLVIVKLLCESGAVTDGGDKRGRTPLLIASEGGHEEVVGHLLNAGAEVNASDGSGATPLHAAVWREHFLVVELLLQKDANARAADNDGNTPLHGVAQTGQEGTARLLMNAGANINAKNRFKETPLFLAVKYHNREIINALRDNSAEVEQFSINPFTTSAETGDTAAMVSLGLCYWLGCGIDIEIDYDQAIEWFHKAASADNAVAMYYLGLLYDVSRLYSHGEGAPKDYAKAAEWYRKAAKQGLARAEYHLGLLYDQGRGVPYDRVEAAKWYRKAAEQGLAHAEYHLGVSSGFRSGGAKDEAEGVKWVRKAAEQGDAYAAYKLGYFYRRCYKEGQCDSEDIPESLKWDRRAVEQGCPLAEIIGYLVPICGFDCTWFHKAAERGVPVAVFYVGIFDERTQDSAQYYAKAVKWYRKAAERGDFDASHKLGYIYADYQSYFHTDSFDDPGDYAEAAKWLRISREQGYALTGRDFSSLDEWDRKAVGQGPAREEYYYGRKYLNGSVTLGATQDYAKAAEWFRKAAERGHADAEYELGTLYLKGSGVPKDDAEALKWLILAEKDSEPEGGISDAAETISILKGQMAASDIRRAQADAAAVLAARKKPIAQ